MTYRTDYHEHHPDSARRRVRDAARPVSVAVRHFAPYPRLHTYRFDLPPGPLYGVQAHREARALVGQTFTAGPAHWKLERGEGGTRHVHVTSPLPPVAVPAAQDARHVYDLRGWMAYLSKPSDARLCRPGPLTAWSPDPYARARAYRAALDEYAAARRAALTVGRRRLSPLSGWVGTRPVRPGVPLLLVMRVAAWMLLWTLARPDGVPRGVQVQEDVPRPFLGICKCRGKPSRPRPPPPRTQAQAR